MKQALMTRWPELAGLRLELTGTDIHVVMPTSDTTTALLMLTAHQAREIARELLRFAFAAELNEDPL